MEEINKIKLSNEQYLLIEDLIEKSNFTIKINQDDNLYNLEASDCHWEILSEKIKDKYVFEGFDKNYELNKKGLIYEQIIDKLYVIGW